MSETDDNATDHNKGRVGIINSISSWLKLLGLVVLVGEVTLIVAMKTYDQDSDYYYLYPISMILLLAMVVVGLFYDRYLDKKYPTPVVQPPDEEEPIEPPEPVDEDEAEDPLLKEIVVNVNTSRKFNFRVFQEQIELDLKGFVLKTRNWKNGELKVPPSRYVGVLLELYEKSERSIFSTTIKSYMDTWDPELMNRMMRSSSESKATNVTRVFVFDDRNMITEESIEIIKVFQENKGIDVKVYIDQEDPTYNFPSQVSKDFVIIDDGEAIGVTDAVDQDRKGAIWYIQDEFRKDNFSRIVKALINGSKSGTELIEWWEKEGKTNAQNEG